MDNKVIEVFEYLGEKLGIAIDWTSENVVPQVTEFMSRYAKYEITKSSVIIMIGVILVIAACIAFKLTIKGYKADKKDSIWLEYYSWGKSPSTFSILTIVCAITASIAGIAMTLTNIFRIIEWAMIPEMKFIEICQTCRGKGRLPLLQFFSKSCSDCKGKGRTVTDFPSKHI